MKMIRFSIPVLLILCCSIICFSFGTVDAQGDSGKTAKSEVKTEKPEDKQVGKTAGKPGDKSANKLGLVNKPRKPKKIKKAEPAKSTKPDDVQTKIGELENLVKKLKNQLDNSNAKQQDLLKNVAELETKVKTLENILPSILDQIARKIPDIPMGEIRRTCAEIRAMDVSIPSGMQWIDPDGQGVGETPINVYCDMTTGSTTIKHDSLAPINVDHCAGAGCYSRSIKYEASMAQIKALTDLSSECRQSITYDCFNAPHKLENTMYSWWNDRNGNSQYFWAGNNAYGIPTCQCGIDGNCAVSSVMCNCDSLAQQQLSDKGVITDKNILPITRLNFGRTQSQSSSGIHTLGNLTCSGYSRQPEPSTKPAEIATPMPTSCDDLKDMGYTLSGFFSIKGHKMMASVYCDFTKLSQDPGFEKFIGYIDVKSVPTYFYVQRNQKFNKPNIPITFDFEQVNVGDAMNPSGKFKASVKGTYFFSFAGLAFFPACSDSCLSSYSVKNEFGLQVSLFLNGNRIGLASVQDSIFVSANQWSPVTLQSTLNLQKGDTVWLEISYLSSGAYLHDDNFHHTHFTGFMLEEEIVDFL